MGDGERDEAEALDAGADDYIVKPFAFVDANPAARFVVRIPTSGLHS